MKKAAIYLFLLSVILASRKTVAQTPLLQDIYVGQVLYVAATIEPK